MHSIVYGCESSNGFVGDFNPHNLDFELNSVRIISVHSIMKDYPSNEQILKVIKCIKMY